MVNAQGLLKAINEVFPDSPQRYCLRHIYNSFQSAGFRGQELKKCVDKARYPYTKNGHEVGMAELKVKCEDAWNWLQTFMSVLGLGLLWIILAKQI